MLSTLCCMNSAARNKCWYCQSFHEVWNFWNPKSAYMPQTLITIAFSVSSAVRSTTIVIQARELLLLGGYSVHYWVIPSYIHIANFNSENLSSQGCQVSMLLNTTCLTCLLCSSNSFTSPMHGRIRPKGHGIRPLANSTQTYTLFGTVLARLRDGSLNNQQNKQIADAQH